tara:strand:- start:3493 stop:3942 length:450 start_codon:yes stop_codon:yes gene_type:complete
VAGLFDERSGGLVTYWKSISAITDLVGTTTSARIYPELAREKKTSGSYIVYVRHSGESVNHLVGASGVRKTVLHVYCYGTTMANADALAVAVRANSANKRGTLTGVYVHWIECTDALDSGVVPATDKSDTHLYWVRVILRITHAEAVGV